MVARSDMVFFYCAYGFLHQSGITDHQCTSVSCVYCASLYAHTMFFQTQQIYSRNQIKMNPPTKKTNNKQNKSLKHTKTDFSNFDLIWQDWLTTQVKIGKHTVHLLHSFNIATVYSITSTGTPPSKFFLPNTLLPS